MARNTMERFLNKISPEPNSGCWLWTAYLNQDGYGKFGVAGEARYAHVWAYETFVVPVPDGLELDHKCRVRSCCNPHHLEPVTHIVNCRRGLVGSQHSSKTHCPSGHPYSESNTRFATQRGGKYVNRLCKICANLANERYRRKAASMNYNPDLMFKEKAVA